jgi:hypothetical protein
VRAVLVASWGGIQHNELGDDVPLLAQALFDWLPSSRSQPTVNVL